MSGTTAAAPLSVQLTGPRADHEKLERARLALVSAETAVGVRHVEWAMPAATPPLAPAPERTPAPDRTAAPIEDHWLPVPPALQGLLPHGAVRRGTALSVLGSTAVLLHLVASLAGEEAWTAVVGRPDLCLAAAIDAGIDPERLVLIPQPGPESAAVLAAVVDGFDVVVVGPCRALSPRERRALGQRVRHRGAVLVSTEPWPETTLQLETAGRSHHGLAQIGRVSGAELVVRATPRGAAPRETTVLIDPVVAPGRRGCTALRKQHEMGRAASPTAPAPAAAAATATAAASTAAPAWSGRRAG